MSFFNTNPSADKLRHVQAQIDDVRETMVQNIDKVLQRGERIEVLVQKTAALDAQSSAFKKNATKLKNQMWWQNAKMNIIMALVCLAVIVTIIVIVCASTGCRSKKK